MLQRRNPELHHTRRSCSDCTFGQHRCCNEYRDVLGNLQGHINPHGAQTSYQFEYSTDRLLGANVQRVTGTTEVSADSATQAVSFAVTGLSKNTRYYFRLVATNSAGSNRGNTLNFNTR